MKKGWILICVSLAFLFVGCDQTFIIYRGEKLPVNTGNNVYTEVHHILETQPTSTPEPPKFNQGLGTTDDNNITDIQNPDKRQIIFDITCDYPGGSITPDSILVQGREASPQNLYDLSAQDYTITKAGYFNLNDTVEAGKGNVTVSKKMLCKPREIRLQIVDAQNRNKIEPSQVLIGSQRVVDGQKVKPCIQPLKIEASGYETLTESGFEVPVGEGAYEIARALNPATTAPVFTPTPVPAPSKITLQFKITGDVPKGEEIAPESVTIDGESVAADDEIKAGSHEVVISQPGYEVYKKQIQVPAGSPIYTLTAELISLPRALDIAISYDVYPSPQQAQKLGEHELYLQNADGGERLAVKNGDKVKPGMYDLTLTRTAYNDVRDRLRIWPAIKPFAIKHVMEAKDRVVKAEVEFDIEPPRDLEPHVISFIDIDTRVPRNVRPDGLIKPGKYSCAILKPGYLMAGGEKNIVIEPEESPFSIEGKMEAQPRQISFSTDYRGQSIPPKKVMIDNRPSNFSNHYLPKKYNVVLEFDKFKTIQKDIEVVPGVGPYVVTLNLDPK